MFKDLTCMTVIGDSHGSKGIMTPVKWDKEATEKGK